MHTLTEILNLLIFEIGWAVGVVVVHAGFLISCEWLCDGEESEGNEWNAGA